MSVVRNIVTEAVREKHGNVSLGMYQPTVEHVITVLDEKVEDIVDTLVEGGTALGASEAQVRDLLMQAGLVEPPQVTQAPASNGEAAPAWATELIARFDRIEAAARRQGLRI